MDNVIVCETDTPIPTIYCASSFGTLVLATTEEQEHRE
jgi:hypothetical protein